MYLCQNFVINKHWVPCSTIIYFQGEIFPVPSGALTFSVVLYLSCSVTAFFILLLRRKIKNLFGGAELGGMIPGKWFSAVILVVLWAVYVILSSLNSVNIISVTFWGFVRKYVPYILLILSDFAWIRIDLLWWNTLVVARIQFLSRLCRQERSFSQDIS